MVATIKIKPKPVSLTVQSVQDKEYDGTVRAVIDGDLVLEGLLPGSSVDAVGGHAEFKSKNVGTAVQVIFLGYDLSGSD